MQELIRMLLSPEFYSQFIEGFGPFGFLVGIFLTMIEAFFPPLPLAAFVAINVIAFGFIRGYVYSYIGTVIGSYAMFLLFGRFGRPYMHKYIERHDKAKSLLQWIHDKGVFPIILLLTFPFTPSVIVSGLAALAEIKKKDYLISLILGKLVMVLSLSFIGVNIQSFFTQPIKSMLLISLTLGMSYMAKFIMGAYEKRVLRHKVIKGHFTHKSLDRRAA